jgi:hypothetical protein
VSATRYDKLAVNYPVFIKLASIRIWLRANESTPGIRSPAIDNFGFSEFFLTKSQIRIIDRAVSFHLQGRIAIVTDAERDAMDAKAAR